MDVVQSQLRKRKYPPKEKALYDPVERIYNHVSQTDTIDEAVDMHATKDSERSPSCLRETK